MFKVFAFGFEPALTDVLKPRLHQIHIAVYKYPAKQLVSGYKWIDVAVTTILSPTQDIHVCRRRQAIQMDTTLYPGYMYQV